MGMTFFPPVKMIKYGEIERVVRNQKFIKKCKADYQRILAAVDWKGDLEIDPFDPGYPEWLGLAIDSGWDQGLRTQVTVFGGNLRDYVAAARIIYGVLLSRREKILMIETTNEGNVGQEATIAASKIFADLGIPFGVGLGDQGIDVINRCGRAVKATVSYYHSSRTLGDKSEFGGVLARMVRQCWDYKELDGVRVDNEGPGIASSGHQLSDPYVMATKRAGDIICGASACCIHPGAGVFMQYMTGTWGIRQANLDEVPGLLEMAHMTKNAEIGLPEGIEEWQKFNTQRLIEPESGRMNKVYGARSGSTSVEIAMGTEGTCSFSVRETCHVQVRNPATGEIILEQDVPKEGEFAVSGLWSYVMKGTIL